MMHITIDDCWGECYENAIKNVLTAVNKVLGTNLTYRDDFLKGHDIAKGLGLRFTVNGDLCHPTQP